MTDDPSARPPADPWAGASPPPEFSFSQLPGASLAGSTEWTVQPPVSWPAEQEHEPEPAASTGPSVGIARVVTVAGGPGAVPGQAGWPGTAAQPGHVGVASIGTGSMLAGAVQPRRRRRRWPWVLGAIAVPAMLLCVVAAVVTAPVRAQWPAEVVIGDQVAGLEPNRSGFVRRAAEAEITTLKQRYGSTHATVEWLGDPADSERRVKLLVVPKLFLDYGAELPKAIDAQGDQLEDVRPEDAGPLGGVLSCGEHVDATELRSVLCIWVDHGSIGHGWIYQGGPREEAVELFRRIRAEVLRRP